MDFFFVFFELLSLCKLEINVYFCKIILKQQVNGNNYIAMKELMAALLKLDGVKEVKPEAMEYDPEIVAKVQRGREDFLKGNCVSIKAAEVWN